MQGASQGVTAAASRPRFSSSDGEGSEDDLTSNGEIASSDLGKILGTILGNSISDLVLWTGKVLRTSSLAMVKYSCVHISLDEILVP